MAAILDFRRFLPSFKSIGLSVQEKRQKIDFRDGRNGDHLEFPIETILTIFDLSVTRCFLPSFESTGFGSGEEVKKIYFQDGRNGGFLEMTIRTMIAIFDLQ